MASTKQSSLSNISSSRGSSYVPRQSTANVMASCYLVDNSAALVQGFHYCTTTLTGMSDFFVLLAGQSGIPEVPSSGVPSPPSSPPLAAISANNEVVVLPKHKNTATRGNGARRGGAASRIREECERLFCETMKTVFLGERNAATHVSLLNGASAMPTDAGKHGYNNGNGFADKGLLTPPDESATGDYLRRASVSSERSAVSSVSSSMDMVEPFTYARPTAWLELWDFAGGASFRGFLCDNATGTERSLFAFFDAAMLVNNSDLKNSLMALIELAESALGCAHLVVCIERRALPQLEDAASLMKGLQWAGFSLTTLDAWTGGEGVDVTSTEWVFMGMEL